MGRLPESRTARAVVVFVTVKSSGVVTAIANVIEDR